ncbi:MULTISPECIES: hypothetical protein [Pseudomonas]|uniref:Uncharacterized protein n=1 Tax=Pseudomonas helleri TaxID=1608996 RepID=A0A6L5I0C7_9PSED|nr:hypothetical protein [Pseudomonas helleri]MQU08597.1 hypothetical protein [Pseudomonas helleri]
MSEIAKNVLAASPDKTSEEILRKYAVAAALEVIAARAPAMTSTGQLEHEMSRLSKYADQIQEALKAK